jgi:tetratricopeptide (TPR) repeat protein
MKAALSNPSIEAGEAATLRGDYLEARSAFEAALEDPDPIVAGVAHHRLGKLSWHEGAFEAATTSFERARSIAIRHDDAELRTSADIGMGGVHFARGEYAKARALYESVRANPLNAQFAGMVLLNLGAIANIEGDLADAHRSYRGAAKAFTETQDYASLAHVYNNLGMLHADKLEWTQADEAYELAARYAEENGNCELLGLTIMNRSEMSCAMGRYETAVEQCDAALAIFAELGSEIPRGTTLRWKGRALRELGQHPLAERALTEAMRIAHRAQARLLEAETMQELGAMLALAGDLAAARKWLQRGLELFTSLGAVREADEVQADLRAIESA